MIVVRSDPDQAQIDSRYFLVQKILQSKPNLYLLRFVDHLDLKPAYLKNESLADVFRFRASRPGETELTCSRSNEGTDKSADESTRETNKNSHKSSYENSNKEADI
jgi:hypothetical protein